MKKTLIFLIVTMLFSAVCCASFNMEMVQNFRWKGQYYDLAIQDNLLFLANKLGIEIYSIEDPGNPQIVSSFLTKGLANGVALNLPFVYVGDVYGFSVWDVTDLQNPIRRSGFTSDSSTGYQERLYYRDGLVFIAAYSSGIQIIDVSDPDHPIVVAHTPTHAYAWDLVLSDQAAYVMDFFSMSIVDIRRPRFPVMRNNIDAMFSSGAAIQDSRLYLGYVDGLRIMDIADPFNPIDISDMGPTGNGTAETVSIKGDFVFVGHGGYIEIYDASDPADPIQISYFYPPGHPRKLIASGDYLYTVLDDNGFLVTDISNPYNPVTVQHINTGVGGTRNDVTVDENYVYLSDWNRGLVIYEQSTPGNLVELANYSVPGSLRDFLFIEDTAYLVCQSEIQIVDILDKTNPRFLGSYQTTGSPQNIQVIGDRMYMCDLYGFFILDISDPANIILKGAEWLASEGNPYDMYIEGSYAFIANGWKGLKVVDISDETDPDLLTVWPGDNSKSYISVHAQTGLLYFLDSGRGLDILDLTDPVNPVQISKIQFEDLTIADFVMQGNLLYLAAGEDGVFVWDVKNAETPVLMAWSDTPGDALGIDADEQHIFVADEYDFCVFEKHEFKSDSSLPEIQIISPIPLAKVTDKKIVIHGIALDKESGIQKVEVSLDEGKSWKQAYGQETWSLSVSGKDIGPLPLRARATDKSGNISMESADTWIYYAPAVPQIFLAGFENTSVTANIESTITISALVKDPWDSIYLKESILYLNGQPTNQVFESTEYNDGYVYYRLEYNHTFIEAGRPDFSIVIKDVYNNESTHWPKVPSRW